MRELKDTYPVFVTEEAEDQLGEILLLSKRGEKIKDRDGREYVVIGRFLENEEDYQGLNKVTVIQRLSDGEHFGYFWWDDVSKYGESIYEPNGEDFGLEGFNSVEDDWDTYTSHAVWVPVEPYTIIGWREPKA